MSFMIAMCKGALAWRMTYLEGEEKDIKP